MYGNTLTLRESFELEGEEGRDASLSISTNIAEGAGRFNPKEKAYFYTIAKGSVYETASLLLLMLKKEIITEQEKDTLYKDLEEIAKMLTALIKPSNSPSPSKL